MSYSLSYSEKHFAVMILWFDCYLHSTECAVCRRWSDLSYCNPCVCSSSTQENTQGRNLAPVFFRAQCLVARMATVPPGSIPEQKYQKLHTSTPVQFLPIALSRMSSKTSLCLNFEYEVRKTNDTVLSN